MEEERFAALDRLDTLWHAAAFSLDGAWAHFREQPTRATYVSLIAALDHLQGVYGEVLRQVNHVARIADARY